MLCADFHAGFCLLKQKVLLVEINSFPKENSQFHMEKLSVFPQFAKVAKTN